jgi:hypothetical protein
MGAGNFLRFFGGTLAESVSSLSMGLLPPPEAFLLRISEVLDRGEGPSAKGLGTATLLTLPLLTSLLVVSGRGVGVAKWERVAAERVEGRLLERH